MPTAPKPVFLKDALDSGDKVARFCVYRFEDGVRKSQIGNAQQASALMDEGWFDCPSKAESAYNESLEATFQQELEEEEPEVAEEIHPSKMDKRTKEYKAWKASQEESE